MKKNENNFMLFKLETRKMCDDNEKNWRLAMSDLGSDSRIKIEKSIEENNEREKVKENEKEKRFLSERKYHQNSENKKIVNQYSFSDDKENFDLNKDGQIFKMNHLIQVSKLIFISFLLSYFISTINCSSLLS